MFSFFRKKSTKREQEYIDKQVKKLPRVVFIIFLIYFLLFATYICWYVYFKSTYGVSRVEGTSMQNTLNPDVLNKYGMDDMVYVNHSKKPERFDIIIVENMELQPDGSTKDVPLIKRAIAFGGEYITIKKSEEDGFYHVYFYDEAAQEARELEEDYVKDFSEWTRVVSADILTGQYDGKFYEYYLSGPNKLNNNRNFVVKEFDGVLYLEVPDNEIFFMGDNRAYSSDARERGPATARRIEGVAEIILPDANKPGANVLAIKIKAIFSFYWQKLTKFFAR